MSKASREGPSSYLRAEEIARLVQQLSPIRKQVILNILEAYSMARREIEHDAEMLAFVRDGISQLLSMAIGRAKD